MPSAYFDFCKKFFEKPPGKNFFAAGFGGWGFGFEIVYNYGFKIECD